MSNNSIFDEIKDYEELYKQVLKNSVGPKKNKKKTLNIHLPWNLTKRFLIVASSIMVGISTWAFALLIDTNHDIENYKGNYIEDFDDYKIPSASSIGNVTNNYDIEKLSIDLAESIVNNAINNKDNVDQEIIKGLGLIVDEVIEERKKEGIINGGYSFNYGNAINDKSDEIGWVEQIYIIVREKLLEVEIYVPETVEEFLQEKVSYNGEFSFDMITNKLEFKPNKKIDMEQRLKNMVELAKFEASTNEKSLGGR